MSDMSPRNQAALLHNRAEPPAVRQPQPGEHLWPIRKDGRQLDCELRDHGPHGEVQISRDREFLFGRQWRARALAVEEADALKARTSPRVCSWSTPWPVAKARRRSRDWVATGIYRGPREGRHARGYRVFVRVEGPTEPNGRLVPKRFPKTATLTEMKQWRQDVQQMLGAPGDPSTSESHRLPRWRRDPLETVKAMPSISDRRLHIRD